MLRTVEATIDSRGNVTLNEQVTVLVPTRALVTILEDSRPGEQSNESALLAERSLSAGWTGPEADESWKHLRELPDLDEAGQ